jgi:hypothetical protein
MKKLILAMGLAATALTFNYAKADIGEYSYSSDPVAMELYQPASPERTIFLGQARLGLFRSRTTLMTNTCARRGERLNAVRFQILNADATVHGIWAQFGNGRVQQLLGGQRYVRRGQTSQWIRLGNQGRFPGQGSCLRGLIFDANSHNANFPNIAVIRAWGNTTRGAVEDVE